MSFCLGIGGYRSSKSRVVCDILLRGDSVLDLIVLLRDKELLNYIKSCFPRREITRGMSESFSLL